MREDEAPKRKAPESPAEKRRRILRHIEKKETQEWIKDVQQPILDKLAAWQPCPHGKKRYRCYKCKTQG